MEYKSGKYGVYNKLKIIEFSKLLLTAVELLH
jgi:hypothetical protein